MAQRRRGRYHASNERSLEQAHCSVPPATKTAESAREQVKSAAGLDDGQMRIFGPRHAAALDRPTRSRKRRARRAPRASRRRRSRGLLLGTIAWAALELTRCRRRRRRRPCPASSRSRCSARSLGFLLRRRMPLADGPRWPIRPPRRTGRWAVVVQPVTLAAARARAVRPARDRRPGRRASPSQGTLRESAPSRRSSGAPAARDARRPPSRAETSGAPRP